MTKTGKTRLLSLLLALVLVVGLLPMTALAAEDATATVDITVQQAGEYLVFARQVQVSAGLAEEYGYTDQVQGVSGLDVLVKAHELLLKEAWTRENAAKYLTVSGSGFVTRMFGQDTTASGFLVNGGFPTDGTDAPYGGGYNGTSVLETPVADGDVVDFFFYQDDEFYSDYVGWFCQAGAYVDSLTVHGGVELSLTVQGTMYMMGYFYKDAAAMHAAGGEGMEDAQLAWVDPDTMALTDIPGAVCDEDGDVTVTAPADNGTYYLTAYMPEEAIEDYFADPLIMQILTITVDNSQSVPEKTCELSALSVATFESNPNAVELKPEFRSDVTEYTVAAGYQSASYARMFYVKAGVADKDMVITAKLNDGAETTVTSGDTYWKALTYLNVGDNTVEVKVAESAAPDAESKVYTIHVYMNDDPTGLTASLTSQNLTVGAENSITAVNGQGQKILCDWTVSDPGALTILDGSDKASDTLRFVPVKKASGVVVTATAAESKTSAQCSLPDIKEPNAGITVPSDATVYVGEKNFTGYNFQRFDTLEPMAVTDNEEDGTTTYYFNMTKTTSQSYLLRVSGEGYVTYADLLTKSGSADLERTVTKEDLQPDGKTSSTIVRDLNANNKYNVADVYLNINAQGYLKLDGVESTHQLINLRTWEAVNNIISNVFVEPDYHYTVVDESGAPSAGVISISEDGLITAVGEGTAIVLVTYDAMTYPTGAGTDKFYGAIWPENTGVFVVSVGAGESGIKTNMTLNAGKNSDTIKLAGDAIDAEHDVIYFTGAQGEYTFTPDSGCAVSVANPIVADKMTFSGFQSVSANSDGSFTVPLVQGRNIVKIEKGGKAEYQVITAKQVTVTINNGEEVHPGDTVSIVFNTLYHPANKLAGVYNMSASAQYTMDGGTVKGGSSQYTFASSANTQQLSVTIPADNAKDCYQLTEGVLYVSGFGDPYGNHRGITLESGKAPNMNAATKTASLGQLPDIEIPIVIADAELESISVTTDDVKTDYYAGESFDPTNLVVTAHYDNGTTQTATNYEISPSVLTKDTTEVTVTYRGKTVTIPVTVKADTVVAIKITTQPSRLAYTEGEVFSPSGMEVTATYASGKTAPTVDYTYEPTHELTTGDTTVTVTYTGSDANDAVLTDTTTITVNPKASDTPPSSNIKVKFTLLGDSAHGDNGEVHTLHSGNLTTWIAQTQVTLNQGSTVIDLVTKALGQAGIPYQNPTGNYISSIRGLAEFDNGPLSGWMYTLNGKHSDLGVAEQTLKNGDVIVFHYTDDYTVEENSENWGSAPGTSGGAATAPNTGTEAETTPNADGTIDVTVKVDGKEVEQVEGGVKVEIPDVKDGQVIVIINADGTETVVKKSVIENGVASAILDGSCTIAIRDNSKDFTDVADNAWYAEAVAFASSHELFNGTGDTTFSPNSPMTRGMLATVLWRLENEAQVSGETNFSDVALNTWYANGVAWASQNGIVDGYGNGKFGPSDNITREQLATMLYRYAKMLGMDTTSSGSLQIFADKDQVSSYAKAAMEWAVGNGLLQGKGNGVLDPSGNATRAEVAIILQRMISLMVK